MRVLEQHEYAMVGGAGTDSLSIMRATGVSISTHVEANNSITVTFSAAGLGTASWNSGEYMACTLIGYGAGLMVTTYSGNVYLGALASIAANYACSQAFSRSDSDGDEF